MICLIITFSTILCVCVDGTCWALPLVYDIVWNPKMIIQGACLRGNDPHAVVQGRTIYATRLFLAALRRRFILPPNGAALLPDVAGLSVHTRGNALVPVPNTAVFYTKFT